MATRSLNKIQLIGNLTRDPELRYTPAGTAVCTLGLATNRQWTTEQGEKKEEVEFHRIIAWNKLAELCSQLLFKGRRVYIEGRIQTRSWTAQDGTSHQTTEVVASDMIILDNKRAGGEDVGAEINLPSESGIPDEAAKAPVTATTAKEKTVSDEAKPGNEEKKKENNPKDGEESEIKPEDIPF